MCQLLGMNANTPTDIVFSFEGFRKRGGLTDHHEDGFGIAFFEQGGVRLLQDNAPSAHSPVGDLVRHYPIKSMNVVSHIRRATQGANTLANTHPFMRELWGEYWVFAHNGQLNLSNLNKVTGQTRCFAPVGTTDSEMAFCYILNQLQTRFANKPADDELFPALNELCQELSECGLFNCLISNGDWQLCFANTLLFYITRQAPFGTAHLIDIEHAIDFGDVTTPNDVVTMFATLPLTENETWHQLYTNECLIFKEGVISYQYRPENARQMSVEEGIKLAQAVGASY